MDLFKLNRSTVAQRVIELISLALDVVADDNFVTEPCCLHQCRSCLVSRSLVGFACVRLEQDGIRGLAAQHDCLC